MADARELQWHDGALWHPALPAGQLAGPAQLRAEAERRLRPGAPITEPDSLPATDDNRAHGERRDIVDAVELLEPSGTLHDSLFDAKTAAQLLFDKNRDDLKLPREALDWGMTRDGTRRRHAGLCFEKDGSGGIQYWIYEMKAP